MKHLFCLGTRTLVATGLGAALFTLLFMFIKVPTGIPGTNLETAYGVGAFFAVLFGPSAGFLIGFIGHALSDAVQYGAPWWSWVTASGLTCFFIGFCHAKIKADEGIFRIRDAFWFNGCQIAANLISWLAAAQLLDIIIYREPKELVFAQGIVAVVTNSISTGVIGTLLLLLYSRTRPKKGSLHRED